MSSKKITAKFDSIEKFIEHIYQSIDEEIQMVQSHICFFKHDLRSLTDHPYTTLSEPERVSHAAAFNQALFIFWDAEFKNDFEDSAGKEWQLFLNTLRSAFLDALKEMDSSPLLNNDDADVSIDAMIELFEMGQCRKENQKSVRRFLDYTIEALSAQLKLLRG